MIIHLSSYGKVVVKLRLHSIVWFISGDVYIEITFQINKYRGLAYSEITMQTRL